MRKWLSAVVIAIVCAGTCAVAQDGPLISPAQLQKILKFLDKIGGKENFPAPVAHDLGLSDDPTMDLPITVLVTNDHKVYFCRSDLDAKDYIIWVRMPDNVSSYMFATHADFKLNRALLLRAAGFPQQEDANAAQVQTIYKKALAALAKDVDTSPSP
jgi:hypothetical protein